MSGKVAISRRFALFRERPTTIRGGGFLLDIRNLHAFSAHNVAIIEQIACALHSAGCQIEDKLLLVVTTNATGNGLHS